MYRKLPETKGKSLEQIEIEFARGASEARGELASG
jgi:hypothetical protein